MYTPLLERTEALLEEALAEKKRNEESWLSRQAQGKGNLLASVQRRLLLILLAVARC